ncbi:hypothetical protein [Burkholderia cepacia]|uniref:hypothetical protein n=1 Tax=Burkholderia cepacia TaxID=292 RepID=UPI002FE0B000
MKPEWRIRKCIVALDRDFVVELVSRVSPKDRYFFTQFAPFYLSSLPIMVFSNVERLGSLRGCVVSGRDRIADAPWSIGRGIWWPSTVVAASRATAKKTLRHRKEKWQTYKTASMRGFS